MQPRSIFMLSVMGCFSLCWRGWARGAGPHLPPADAGTLVWLLPVFYPPPAPGSEEPAPRRHRVSTEASVSDVRSEARSHRRSWACWERPELQHLGTGRLGCHQHAPCSGVTRALRRFALFLHCLSSEHNFFPIWHFLRCPQTTSFTCSLLQ